MTVKSTYIIFMGILLVFLCTSCNKTEFLKEKPNQSQVIPTTLDDFQALLDEDNVFNGGGSFGIVPNLGQIASDDFWTVDASFDASNPYERNAFIWAEEIYEGTAIKDWSFPYRAVLYANIALEGIEEIIPKNSAEQQKWNNIKGSALFYRAYMFFQLAQVFAPQYEKAIAKSALGIPLRLSADVNESLTRATLQQTYDRILADLEESIPLLPPTPLYKTRPSKASAFAMLAKTHLVMQAFEKALAYSDSCLKYYNTMLNYNAILGSTGTYPIPLFNDDVIFHTTLLAGAKILSINRARIDTTLVEWYAEKDLRTQFFLRDYQNTKTYTGTYAGGPILFSGIGADEVMLMKAECEARYGNTQTAINTLNTLLETRWKTNTYIPISVSNAEEALDVVLRERRKQLLFRGIRWSDLRRLNLEERFAKTLTRTIKGETYTLPPKDKRYVFPIPDEVISLNPKIEQNDR